MRPCCWARSATCSGALSRARRCSCAVTVIGRSVPGCAGCGPAGHREGVRALREAAEMVEITYFLYTAPLAGAFLTESRTLPQDPATAAAQLAALVARNPSRGRWPGAYVARITPDDGSQPWTLTEDDPAVAKARGVLE